MPQPHGAVHGKGGLRILLTLPSSMRSFKRKEKAASSTPGIPAFRNAVTGRLDSEKPRFQVWKAADERKHRAVSGHGIPGAMLVFSQTFSKGAVLPTECTLSWESGWSSAHSRSRGMTHIGSQPLGSARFYNHLGVKKKDTGNTDRPWDAVLSEIRRRDTPSTEKSSSIPLWEDRKPFPFPMGYGRFPDGSDGCSGTL